MAATLWSKLLDFCQPSWVPESLYCYCLDFLLWPGLFLTCLIRSPGLTPWLALLPSPAPDHGLFHGLRFSILFLPVFQHQILACLHSCKPASPAWIHSVWSPAGFHCCSLCTPCQVLPRTSRDCSPAVFTVFSSILQTLTSFLFWILLATCASLGITPSVPNLGGVLHLAARGALSAFRPPTRYMYMPYGLPIWLLSSLLLLYRIFLVWDFPGVY